MCAGLSGGGWCHAVDGFDTLDQLDREYLAGRENSHLLPNMPATPAGLHDRTVVVTDSADHKRVDCAAPDGLAADGHQFDGRRIVIFFAAQRMSNEADALFLGCDPVKPTVQVDRVEAGDRHWLDPLMCTLLRDAKVNIYITNRNKSQYCLPL